MFRDPEKRTPILVVAMAIVLIVAYKFWKQYLREVVGLDPIADYYVYEMANSGFRALSSIVGIAASLKLVSAKDLFGQPDNRLVKILCSFLVFSLFSKLAFSSPVKFQLTPFLWEIPFNLLTGISEELVFRGMILVGLWRLFGFWAAAGISSLIFSAWHYDVVTDALGYLYLVTFGIFTCLAFAVYRSLISLIFMHFAWDQVVYGLDWASTGGKGLYFALSVINIGATLAILLPAIKNTGKWSPPILEN